MVIGYNFYFCLLHVALHPTGLLWFVVVSSKFAAPFSSSYWEKKTARFGPFSFYENETLVRKWTHVYSYISIYKLYEIRGGKIEILIRFWITYSFKRDRIKFELCCSCTGSWRKSNWNFGFAKWTWIPSHFLFSFFSLKN